MQVFLAVVPISAIARAVRPPGKPTVTSEAPNTCGSGESLRAGVHARVGCAVAGSREAPKILCGRPPVRLPADRWWPRAVFGGPATASRAPHCNEAPDMRVRALIIPRACVRARFASISDRSKNSSPQIFGASKARDGGSDESYAQRGGGSGRRGAKPAAPGARNAGGEAPSNRWCCV